MYVFNMTCIEYVSMLVTKVFKFQTVQMEKGGKIYSRPDDVSFVRYISWILRWSDLPRYYASFV